MAALSLPDLLSVNISFTLISQDFLFICFSIEEIE